jgi:hypothetical protein
MGALNSNVFATGRLVVAASNRNYFPGILANLHVTDGAKESDYYRRALAMCPSPLVTLIVRFAEATYTLRLEKQVPM